MSIISREPRPVFRTQEELDEHLARAGAHLELVEAPPCPSWCTAGAGHAYDFLGVEDEWTFGRSHERSFGERVHLVVEETWSHGRVSVDEPEILLTDVERGDGLDERAALALANNLHMAVDMLRAIKGGRRRP